MDATHATLEDLIAKLFIARPDVKAIQQPGGEYFTHTRGPRENPTYIPWSRSELTAHLAGTSTFGHYLLSTDNKCKFFAFDVDLDKVGTLPTLPMDNVNSDEDAQAWVSSFRAGSNPREAWKDRAHPARPFLKGALMQAAIKLEREISKLGIPALTVYSGNKGIHVYGFLGLMEAGLVRQAGFLVMEALGCVQVKGDIFWKFGQSLEDDLNDLLTIELFPKQDELDEGRFGNLMRVPLGRNLKSADPTFIIDTSGNSPINVMVPVQDAHASLASVLESLQTAQLV